ncbi:phage virion morphogenesis protein [Limnobaculum xujianqingii]|uniref:phage virion morphogenesis protein n=1 Tax=Limnobaculum xujianqingii TaxID=2738837 RepID=UPI00112E3A21|nr:phage virion morphogenesis protein [Limnobaculum xujianqingii]
MATITVQLDSAPVNQLLSQIEQAGLDLTSVFKNIGEILLNSTRRRFEVGMGPLGEQWATNSPVTLANKRDPRPLIGDTRSLSTQISYTSDADHVLLASLMEYGGTQQFGAKKGQYGQTRHGVPLPWGDIEARPFIGLSPEDEEDILDLLERYLARAAGTMD